MTDTVTDPLLDFFLAANPGVKMGQLMNPIRLPNGRWLDAPSMPGSILVNGYTDDQKFVDYLTSPAAQAIWAKQGYRPVISGVSAANFPTPPGLFTIDTLGGWKKVTKDFFEPETGIVTKIEQSLGVSTAK